MEAGLKGKKVAFFTPYLKSNRGNATTTRRIIHGLKSVGLNPFIIAYEEESLTNSIRYALESADLFHILHFYRFFRWSHEHNLEINKPYVMTSGGTDINVNLEHPTQAQEMKELLANANAITVFTASGKEKLVSKYHQLITKIEVIPQSVWIPKNTFPMEGCFPTGFPNILLPAGLRPVKDVLYLMDEIQELKGEFRELQFIIAGPIIDSKVYEKVMCYCEKFNWMTYLENVPLERMSHLYEWADMVLNTSISEGQSIALLEAMSIKLVVFGRDNDGNRSLITDYQNGFLFSNGDDFLLKARHVLRNPSLREKVGLQAQQYVKNNHALWDEIKSYLHVYQEALK